jgi:hypothetical protein
MYRAEVEHCRPTRIAADVAGHPSLPADSLLEAPSAAGAKAASRRLAEVVEVNAVTTVFGGHLDHGIDSSFWLSGCAA